MKINFSKAFMEKFGDVVFKKKEENLKKNLMPTAWYINLLKYPIDWKTRRKVHLVHWLKDQVESDFIKSIVEKEKFKDVKDLDDRMFSIFRWVCRTLRYVGDKQNWDVGEYWATAQETIEEKKGKGDCEDGAIVTLLLARASGIPHERIKIACGNVKGGGHAWALYTANDGAIYCMDWCYWRDYTGFPMRKSLYELSNYYYGQKIWFAVNDISGYSG